MSEIQQWLEITGDDGDLYMIDVNWMLSTYSCIWGKGCKGIEDGKPFGCCPHGAWFTGKPDFENVKRAVRKLDKTIWQYKPSGPYTVTSWVAKKGNGEIERTRRINGHCIFYNEAGFEGGEGCAFHLAAMRDGVHHSEYKPDVCWQVPIRVEPIKGKEDSYELRAWNYEDWGDLDWWCINDTEAYQHAGQDNLIGGSKRVYQTFEEELRLIMGDEAYRQLRDYCDDRRRGTPVPVMMGRKKGDGRS